MKSRQFVFICISIYLLQIVHIIPKVSANTCVWYGECPQDGKVYNCIYGGPAKSVSSESYDILRKLCPQLDKGSLDGTYTCCDLNQLRSLERQVGLLSDFTRRCPACDLNLRGFFCQMTCSQDQAVFMSAAETNGKSIVRLNLSVSFDYVNRILDSCRNVQFSSGGQNALDVICQRDAEHCTPADLMAVFQANSPFNLNINLTQNDRSMQSDVWNCNAPIKYPAVAYGKCSCSDCQSSCPTSCPFEEEPSFLIGSLNGFVFVALMVWFVIITGTVTSIIVSVVKHRYTGSGQCMTNSENLEDHDDGPDENTPLLENEVETNSSAVLYTEMFGHLCARSGRFICNFWFVFTILGLIIAFILSAGMFRVNLTTDPNILWSIRNSRALADKRRFDHTFGPFYRTSQVFLQTKSRGVFYKMYTSDPFMVYEFNDALSVENLRVLSELQESIEALVTKTNISLHDVCYKAVNEQQCTVFSLMEYFQNDRTLLDKAVGYEDCGNLTADWASHILHCFQSPLSNLDSSLNLSCLGRYQGPIEPFLAVAGYDEPSQPYNCSSLVLTYLLNSTDSRSMEWEQTFLEFMRNYSQIDNNTFDVVYSAERSIEDQILVESWADVRTITMSYILMFAYITIALSFSRHSNERGLSGWAVSQSKIVVAFGSIVFVLFAVTSSVGLLAYIGIPTTMLIFEVLPFLVLAVGFDNTFILCRQCKLCTEHLSPTDAVVDDTRSFNTPRTCANTLHRVGPGLILANIAEVSCFILSTILADVYAVRLFALTAAIALIINIIFQILLFIPLLYLDCRRVHSRRLDIFCCISPSSQNEVDTVSYPPVPPRPEPLLSQTHVVQKSIRVLIVFAFLCVPCIVIALFSKLPAGLEPSIIVPKDSYVQKYLNQVKTLNIGPPVFFVIENMNLNETDQQNLICGGTYCRSDSLLAQLTVAEICANVSWIARAPSSWLDGYFDWISTNGCCRVDSKTGLFCPSDKLDCPMCSVKLNNISRPEENDFYKYISFFTQDNPNERCPFGGHPLHKAAINDKDDYISALKRSWEIVDSAYSKLAKHIAATDFKLYSYSIFYVFYEQYLEMHRQLYISGAVSLGLIFFLSFAFTGFDLMIAISVTLTCWAILVDMVGLMIIWSIPLNAISIVNLTMSIGIAVEFCAHIAMNFARNRYSIPGPTKRAYNSVKEIGSSVFTGIGLTKLIGISVLAFAHSQLFTLLFFRMYFGLILIGIVHGMIFLPTLLSLIGFGNDCCYSENQDLLQYVTVFPDDCDDPLE